MYVIGKTGVGKTTLMENMAIQDILSGEGVGIIDPHGEFAEKNAEIRPRKSRQRRALFRSARYGLAYRFQCYGKCGPDPKGIWWPTDYSECSRKFGRMFGRPEWSTF